MGLKRNFACSWSGGKDSCIAMYKAMKKGWLPEVAMTMFIEDGSKSRSHGISGDIVSKQIDSLGLSLEKESTTWNDYENKFIRKLKFIKEKYNIGSVVFGDIDIEEHRNWEEMVCDRAGLKAYLPLWQLDREEVLGQFLGYGFKALIIAINLDKLPSRV